MASGEPQRVGLIGGTFDPIHWGHLIMAEEARHQAHLDQVLFLPAGEPPHKVGQAITPIAHRLQMVQLAIASNPAFRLSRLDVDRPGPHYSVDMVRLFLERAPAGTEVFFVVGADSLEDMPTWKDPARLLELCHVLAMSRPGHQPNLEHLAQVLPAVWERVQVLSMPLIGISGTDIRRRVREGRPIRYLVPEEVRQYIVAHGLYRPSSPGGAPL
ncbi:MAG: nicotinate-nucleotide adenylyltransferase [Anaerolineae bacterium]|nr:nicotinate-nucleotide adenylyltransferase [Anaerolineae bacterium]